jgi:hypothetical protein
MEYTVVLFATDALKDACHAAVLAELLSRPYGASHASRRHAMTSVAIKNTMMASDLPS